MENATGAKIIICSETFKLNAPGICAHSFSLAMNSCDECTSIKKKWVEKSGWHDLSTKIAQSLLPAVIANFNCRPKLKIITSNTWIISRPIFFFSFILFSRSHIFHWNFENDDMLPHSETRKFIEVVTVIMWHCGVSKVPSMMLQNRVTLESRRRVAWCVHEADYIIK